MKWFAGVLRPSRSTSRNWPPMPSKIPMMTHLKALKELLPLHDELQAGRPLDFTRLNEAISRLQNFAGAINASLGKGGNK